MADYAIGEKALNVDIVIEKGATFDPVITFKDKEGVPIPISTWTAKMQIRDLEDDTIILDTLTEVDGLVLGVDGTITFNLIKTRNIAYDWSAGKFDLFLNSGTKDYKIMYGDASTVERVTV